MKLSELISPERCVIGWPNSKKPSDKWLLLDQINTFTANCLNFDSKQTEAARNILIDREKSMSTGIGDGVAIPHCTLDFLKIAGGSLILLPEPVDFQSIDHRPAQIVILIFMPKDQFERHIETLASITRLLYNAQIREQLLKSSSSENAFQQIKALEEEQ